jgi:hypothetical protein
VLRSGVREPAGGNFLAAKDWHFLQCLAEVFEKSWDSLYSLSAGFPFPTGAILRRFVSEKMKENDHCPPFFGLQENARLKSGQQNNLK